MSNSEDQKYATNHQYDDIRELDYPLPRWWLGTFYGAIIFSVFYWGYYHVGPGRGLMEEFDRESQEQNFAASTTPGEQLPSEDSLLAVFKDPERKKQGATVYQGKCASCHGPQGQGLIGPNLTDNYWIHGGKLAEIAKTVSTGVLDKGMPAWSSMISKAELESVVVYVKSLKGTNPPNPKAPQGDLIKE